MSSWLYIVIAAYFIQAITAFVDKHILVSKKVSSPLVYVFYTMLLSGFSVFIFLFSFLPFSIPNVGPIIPSIDRVILPSLEVLILSFLSGIAIFLALLFLF